MARGIWIAPALGSLMLTAAVGTASGNEDPVSQLRHARSLRCTYSASAMTAFMPDRRITTEHDQMIVVYDNINIERGTARVIYENGVPGGAGNLTVRWQANALWLIETAPAGNLIVMAVADPYGVAGAAEVNDSAAFGRRFRSVRIFRDTARPGPRNCRDLRGLLPALVYVS